MTFPGRNFSDAGEKAGGYFYFGGGQRNEGDGEGKIKASQSTGQAMWELAQGLLCLIQNQGWICSGVHSEQTPVCERIAGGKKGKGVYFLQDMFEKAQVHLVSD